VNGAIVFQNGMIVVSGTDAEGRLGKLYVFSEQYELIREITIDTHYDMSSCISQLLLFEQDTFICASDAGTFKVNPYTATLTLIAQRYEKIKLLHY
jgi:cyanophycinase-like exopeptidase